MYRKCILDISYDMLYSTCCGLKRDTERIGFKSAVRRREESDLLACHAVFVRIRYVWQHSVRGVAFVAYIEKYAVTVQWQTDSWNA